MYLHNQNCNELQLFANKSNIVNYVNMHTKCGCEHVSNL